MIINAIPEIRYRDFHGIIIVWMCKKTGGPCVYAEGTTESGYEYNFFVCENLDRNVMKYFSNEEGTIPSTIYFKHASRMVLLY